MVATLGPFKLNDLERMREETRDRLELIDGEVFVVPAPGVLHQGSSTRLVHLLFDQVELRALGRVFHAPIDVRLSDAQIVQPDLVVVLPGDGATIQADGIVGPPTLVVEIISPSSRVQDRLRKRARYAEAGIPEYWLVDPALRSILALADPGAGEYRGETTYEAGDMLRSTAIPSVMIPVASVFLPVDERA